MLQMSGLVSCVRRVMTTLANIAKAGLTFEF
jgi:hypothetical protein